MRVIWTAFAIAELKNIFDYYKANAGISVAQKIKNEIFASTRQLQKHPLSGPMEENLLGSPYEYRYLVEGNYKIIYRIFKQYILHYRYF